MITRNKPAVPPKKQDLCRNFNFSIFRLCKHLTSTLSTTSKSTSMIWYLTKLSQVSITFCHQKYILSIYTLRDEKELQHYSFLVTFLTKYHCWPADTRYIVHIMWSLPTNYNINVVVYSAGYSHNIRIIFTFYQRLTLVV